MGGRRTTLVFTWLFLVALAPPAHAALFLEFDRPSAHPGTVVVGRTAGEGALAVGPGRAFPVYLDPFETKDRIPIGHVIVDARGNGTLKFEVPDVPGGKYTVLMSCHPCAANSAGRIVVPLGDFRVLGPPAPPPAPKSESWLPGALVLSGVIVLGVLVYLRRGRAPSHAT